MLVIFKLYDYVVVSEYATSGAIQYVCNACICAHTCIHIHMHIYECINIFEHVYMCMYIHIYIYMCQMCILYDSAAISEYATKRGNIVCK